MKNRVTAVITTHKREPEMVERALKSVLAQTHPDMEVIVVGDSPADFPQRVAVVIMGMIQLVFYRKDVQKLLKGR